MPALISKSERSVVTHFARRSTWRFLEITGYSRFSSTEERLSLMVSIINAR